MYLGYPTLVKIKVNEFERTRGVGVMITPNVGGMETNGVGIVSYLNREFGSFFPGLGVQIGSEMKHTVLGKSFRLNGIE